MRNKLNLNKFKIVKKLIIILQKKEFLYIYETDIFNN